MEKFIYETEDGYYNTVFHINGDRYTNAKSNTLAYDSRLQRPVILYQHGLLDSCDSVFCDGEESFAFFLVDRGYDVWFGNSRGNKYSQSHRYLSTALPEYWDFSFQELGLFD